MPVTQSQVWEAIHHSLGIATDKWFAEDLDDELVCCGVALRYLSTVIGGDTDIFICDVCHKEYEA